MSSVRVQGTTKCGRVFYARASTYEAGVQALKNWGNNPELGFGTGGAKVQPASLEFVSFGDAGPVPSHTPEVDRAPAASKK